MRYVKPRTNKNNLTYEMKKVYEMDQWVIFFDIVQEMASCWNTKARIQVWLNKRVLDNNPV